MRLLCAYVCSLVLLAGCGGGGGGGSDDPVAGPPLAEGQYGGTLTGSAYPSFQMLVLDGGEYWVTYGIQTSTDFLVAGFVQGSGTSSNGTFTSNNARDFGSAPSVAASLTATYTATPTLSGSLSNNSGSVSFSGAAIVGSTYNYGTAAVLSTVVGSWSLGTLSGETIALNIDSGGAFTATSSLGCSFTGTVAPRPSGKNVYNVSLTFAGSPCALPNTSATGIAIAYPTGSGQTQLLVAVKDAARAYGTLAYGTR